MTPPSPAQPKSLRFALTLNLFLPGAGQWYLGQPVLGAVYAVGFVGCFLTSLVLFLQGYRKYLEISTSGQLLENADLDGLARAFHTPVLVGVLVVALLLYIVSIASLGFARRNKS